MPTGSSLGRAALRDSGIRSDTASSATAITGTLMRNTEPHQNVVSSQPPTIGPSGYEAMAELATIANARCRSASSKSTGRTERLNGSTNAAASPSKARAAMSCWAEDAYAQASEPSPKRVRPASSSRLRPKRSPSSPAGSIAAPRTSR
jgi:hypothetical protein